MVQRTRTATLERIDELPPQQESGQETTDRIVIHAPASERSPLLTSLLFRHTASRAFIDIDYESMTADQLEEVLRLKERDKNILLFGGVAVFAVALMLAIFLHEWIIDKSVSNILIGATFLLSFVAIYKLSAARAVLSAECKVIAQKLMPQPEEIMSA